MRLLAALGRGLDWLDQVRDDLTLLRCHWRLLRAARDPSPIQRVKIAIGYQLRALANLPPALLKGEPE